MKYKRIRKIKDNFRCFGCQDMFYYSPSYCCQTIYCEDCQDKKSIFGKLLERLFY